MSFWKLFDKNCFACGKWIWNNKAEFLSDFLVWLSYLGSLYLEFTTGTLPLFGRDYNHMELVLELFILIYRVEKKTVVLVNVLKSRLYMCRYLNLLCVIMFVIMFAFAYFLAVNYICNSGTLMQGNTLLLSLISSLYLIIYIEELSFGGGIIMSYKAKMTITYLNPSVFGC